MKSLLKRIAGSAPVWAWIVMGVCVVVLVVGLIVSSNRTAPASSTAANATSSMVAANTPSDSTASSASATPATVRFIDDTKANPASPRTIVLLGDSTGADPNGWAPALGRAISQNFQRPVATRFWNPTTNTYGPVVGLGNGPNGPVGFWNASAAGKNVAYTRQNLASMITPDVKPDVIMLNFGSTEKSGQPLADQIQPLIADLHSKYRQAQIAAIKQSPRLGADSSAQLWGFAAAMDAEGIQVIDVYSAFPSDQTALRTVLSDSTNPNATGQKLWTRTVLAAYGLPEPPQS